MNTGNVLTSLREFKSRVRSLSNLQVANSSGFDTESREKITVNAHLFFCSRMSCMALPLASRVACADKM